MNNSPTTVDRIAQAGDQLFQFAIHRGDMQSILDALPPEAQADRVVMEYEIQLLRIITVGWAIAFLLADDSPRKPMGECFWKHVRAFSETLSTSASLTADAPIDYFEILKQRFDFYLEALNAAGKGVDPAMIIGPAFAGACGDRQNAFAVLAGSKMFAHTVHAVREYLDERVTQQD